MRNAMIKTTIREIKGSLGRYLAILAIVLLGVAFFSGLKVTKPAMIETLDYYLKEKNFYDFRLLSTIGFTEEDVDELSGMNGIEDIEGTISVDALCLDETGNEVVYKIHEMPESINRIEITAGREPEQADECVMDSALYDESVIGTEITVTENNDEDTLSMFTVRTLKVVGLARSSYYINFERGTTSIGDGKVNGYIYVPAETFDSEYMTDVFITVEEKYYVLSDEYYDYIDAMQESVESKTEEVIMDRYHKLVEDAVKEMKSAQMQLEASQMELGEEAAKVQEQLADAMEELEDWEEPDCYVFTRDANVGYACFESDANIVAAVADVFPVFFFLVAALICMTTMNRMVEEQRTQIGVLKALGYGNGAIMGKFVFYAGSAAFIGAVLGFFGGTWLFPKTIWTGYSIMYDMGKLYYLFDGTMMLISLLAALVCSVGTAYLSCRYELLSAPANLIRPKAPKNGKRIFLEYITFIWSRMKFLHKVSFRNMIRYKKRFFMMILGISGCTALLVAGFGIRDSVANIGELQFKQIQKFDLGVTFADALTQEEQEHLKEISAELVEDFEYRLEESVDLIYAGQTKTVYLEIPQNEEKIERFLDLHTEEGETLAYPKEGEAVLTAKTAETLGIQTGDEITLRDNDMHQMTVRVSGICENFVYNYVYLNAETYQKQLGREPEYKSAFVNVKEGIEVHEASAEISGLDNILAVSVTEDMRGRIDNMLTSMNYIVALVILCAGALAFIVLYNLTNINITERLREIATIKVLGFYAKETADYVFRENVMLTAVGALFGLLLGKWLHWFIMYQIRIDMVSFKTYVSPLSYFLSFVLTIVFSMFVNGLMQFKLEKINMAESLKSIE